MGRYGIVCNIGSPTGSQTGHPKDGKSAEVVRSAHSLFRGNIGAEPPEKTFYRCYFFGGIQVVRFIRHLFDQNMVLLVAAGETSG